MNGNDTNYYANSDQLISDLKQQQVLLQQMALAEEDKKKTDKDKVKGYREQSEAITKEIEETEKAVSQMRLQTDINSLSQSISDALVSAFESGESAIDSLDKAFDQFIKNALVNSLRIKLIAPLIEGMVNELDAHMKKNEKELNPLAGFDFDSWKDKIAAGGKIFTDTLDKAYEGLDLKKEGEGGDRKSVV